MEGGEGPLRGPVEAAGAGAAVDVASAASFSFFACRPRLAVAASSSEEEEEVEEEEEELSSESESLSLVDSGRGIAAGSTAFALPLSFGACVADHQLGSLSKAAERTHGILFRA